jgi:hypothetical protein
VLSIRLSVPIDDAIIQAAARQFPFAASQALNDIAKAFQAQQLKYMRGHYTLRRPDFASKSVKITRFARKDSLVAEIAIDSPGGRSDVFAKFEAGDDKLPRSGRSLLAVPRVGSIVKPRKRALVPDELKPSALRDSPLLTIRTFVKPIKKNPSRLGIFAVDRAAEARKNASRRRNGRVLKRDANRARPSLLYTLIPKAEIAADLGFEVRGRDVIAGAWGDAFGRRWNAALASAR